MNNNWNMLNMLTNLRQNPVQTLLSANLNIPQNIANNPQAIVQHLFSSGQVSQLNIPQNITNNPQAIVQYLLSSGQVSQSQVNQAIQQRYA